MHRTATRPLTLCLPFIASLIAAGCASMGEPPAEPKGTVGYVTDPNGNIVHNGTGQCVRTGSWTPQNAVKECDPDLFAQAEPPKPVETSQAPQPEPAAAAPAVVAAAPAPEPVRVFIGTDAYFGFNQVALNDNSKHDLDRIAERAKKDTDGLAVNVVGFTDQIGSNDYNAALSQRRADAVRTYLIEQGVPENVISVDARGETDPVVSCDGEKGEQLIACLQPNRRTEVQFSALEAPEGR